MSSFLLEAVRENDFLQFFLKQFPKSKHPNHYLNILMKKKLDISLRADREASELCANVCFRCIGRVSTEILALN